MTPQNWFVTGFGDGILRGQCATLMFTAICQIVIMGRELQGLVKTTSF